MPLLGTIGDVVDAYREFLSKQQAASAKASPLARFERLLRSREDAAHAEAVVFDFLDQCHLDPQNFEDPSTGGPDFECRYGRQRFAVEVTSIGEPTLTSRSGMTNEPQVSYIDLAALIRAFASRVSSKTTKPQARAYGGPRVLAIVAKHIAMSALFAEGVEGFATTAFCVKEKSVFRAFRGAYAIVLLVQITGDSSWIAGAIHPEPAYILDIDVFPEVPFVRITPWPTTSEHLKTEWVIARPHPMKFLYLPRALRQVLP